MLRERAHASALQNVDRPRRRWRNYDILRTTTNRRIQAWVMGNVNVPMRLFLRLPFATPALVHHAWTRCGETVEVS